MTKRWDDFNPGKDSNPAQWPHPERVQCLRAFMEWAHSANPAHDMRGKEDEALRLAYEHNSPIGAFLVFKDMKIRALVVSRFHDFSQGWEYRRLLVND